MWLIMSEAVSEFVQRGLRPELPVTGEGDFPQFDVPEGAEPITLEQTLNVENEP
jgi:hypothetical protein